MRTSIELQKARRKRSEFYRRSEAVVATLWLVFYVVAIGIAASSPIVSRAIELAGGYP